MFQRIVEEDDIEVYGECKEYYIKPDLAIIQWNEVTRDEIIDAYKAVITVPGSRFIDMHPIDYFEIGFMDGAKNYFEDPENEDEKLRPYMTGISVCRHGHVKAIVADRFTDTSFEVPMFYIDKDTLRVANEAVFRRDSTGLRVIE